MSYSAILTIRSNGYHCAPRRGGQLKQHKTSTVLHLMVIV